MNKKMVWRRGSASAAVTLVGGLLTVDYGGVLTRPLWAEAAAFAESVGAGRHSVVLLDMTCALVCIEDQQPDRPARSSLARPELPGAVVVSELLLPAYRRQSLALAREGVRRLVFSSRPEAQAWVTNLLLWQRPAHPQSRADGLPSCAAPQRAICASSASSQ